MTPEPRNDAPVSGVPLSVIIDTLRERLKATRADLEQAKRERDKLATVLAQAEEAASSSDVVGAIRYNWKAFQKQAQLLERYRDGLASMTKGRDAALAQADALRQRVKELETALGQCGPMLEAKATFPLCGSAAEILATIRALRDTTAPQQHAPDAPTP